MKILATILAASAILVFAASAGDAAGGPARGAAGPGTFHTQPSAAYDPLRGQHAFLTQLRGARSPATGALVMIELDRVTSRRPTFLQLFNYRWCMYWTGGLLGCAGYLGNARLGPPRAGRRSAHRERRPTQSPPPAFWPRVSCALADRGRGALPSPRSSVTSDRERGPGLCRAFAAGRAGALPSERLLAAAIASGGRQHKETQMKSWTPILAAAAILVVAVPAGNAASSTIPSDPGTSANRVVQRAVPSAATDAQNAAQIKRLIAKNKALAAKNKALVAQGKALNRKIKALDAWISSLIRDRGQSFGLPSGNGTPVVVDQQLQECIDFGTGCTDEQLCLHWGYTCDLPASENGAKTDESTVESGPIEVLISEDLPSLDSSDLPPEVTGTVGFDYSVYDWEG